MKKTENQALANFKDSGAQNTSAARDVNVHNFAHKITVHKK